MSPEVVRCSICGKAIKVKDFKDQMAKIRRHREKYHPSAFRKSIRKGVATRSSRR